MIKLNGVQVDPNKFPDGTFCLRLQTSDVETYGPCYTIDWRWEDNASEYMMLYHLVRHLQDKCNGRNIRLILPYVPDARMDRTKDYTREVFTLKYFAQFLNDLRLSEVVVFDPHSDMTPALINNCKVIPADPFYLEALRLSKADIVFYPDDGAMNRYHPTGSTRKFLCGKKDRDWKTGKIQGLKVQNPMELGLADINGAHALIIDDICSKGGTFYHSGVALKNLGVERIDLYVTHCENAIFEGKLFKEDSPISQIYTTDSIVRPRNTRICTMPIYTEDWITSIVI